MPPTVEQATPVPRKLHGYDAAAVDGLVAAPVRDGGGHRGVREQPGQVGEDVVLVLHFAYVLFVVGGLVVARLGLGRSPLRTMMLANVAMWSAASVFTLQASIMLLAVGMFVWLCLAPIVEAAEQTILQKVVAPERQGRVFGFAQSVEQAATPITALLMGPMGFVAVLAGWITTEVGRQPFTVYGLLRTAESAAPVAAEAVAASLLAFIIVYFTVFGAGVFYILRLMARPPIPDEPDSPSDAHLRSAGIVPAPALDSVGELQPHKEGLR